MIDVKRGLRDVNSGSHVHKKKVYSNTIYTLDIEVTSMFKLGGKWSPFVYDDEIDYTKVEHAAVPYIWMMGINEKVYYGREFMDLEKYFKQLSNPVVTKIFWIFNLSYEMQFLLDIFQNYTIEDMVARESHKPIIFRVKELNLEFRCAFMLTNMKLETAAKEYTDVTKKTGDLDYNVLRSPKTKLSKKEKGYCEFDIISLYKVIRYFEKEYKTLAAIPVTSTSTVRKALKDVLDYWYIKKMWKLVPDKEMMERLMVLFMGGYTHANLLRAGRILHGVKSKDIASSYPACIVTEKFPVKPFLECLDPNEFLEPKKNYAYFALVTFKNIRSKFYNNYIPSSRCIDCSLKNSTIDNGRIVNSPELSIYITDVDWDIIKEAYKWDEMIVETAWSAYKDYLDIRVIKFVLDLYGSKTQLKGLTDEQSVSVYKAIKPKINGIFGMMVSNPLHQTTYYSNPSDKNFDGRYWRSHSEGRVTQFMEEKLLEMESSFSTLFYYPQGCWITAYARRNLLKMFLRDDRHKFDRDVCYCDTDSIKFLGDYEEYFEEYNRNMDLKYQAVIDEFPDDLTMEMFKPKDRFGVEHPIGYYEDDGVYQTYKTLGAKKYAYEDEKGLHITVSGVSKDGAEAMKGIEDFRKGFKWGYAASGKLIHYYNDEQPDITFEDVDGNIYTSHYRHTVVLQPTSYTLGTTEVYDYLLELLMKIEEGRAIQI